MLFHFPNIIGFQQFCKVMIFLLTADFFYLGCHTLIVGRSINITDNTQGYGESVAITHESKLQLQGVVFTMSVVDKHVFQGVAVFTDTNNLQAKALLYKSELIVLTENQLMTMAHINCILLATFLIINSLMCSIIKDNTVL